MSTSITKAITAILAFSVAGSANANQDMPQSMGNIKGMEKCYGVAKAHQNDCGTEAHGCGGEAKQDGDQSEFVLVPTGLCKKIVGGKTKS